MAGFVSVVVAAAGRHAWRAGWSRKGSARIDSLAGGHSYGYDLHEHSWAHIGELSEGTFDDHAMGEGYVFQDGSDEDVWTGDESPDD